ncbi:SlyX family protein [Desulfoplanes formicivorans]|uniref:Lysis protein n=1 Tax=Desulfoplanes formicivorans TaxID=1592317 RepID=A0A194AK20_9BACT|nr:SlyX family protein [Desulfoplanes formicivorans]GAU09658.1 lysis protein [Desulfoplanes formicivorans]
MDDQLEKLQTQIAFQERSIEKLNQALISQQCQIDELERQIRILAEKLLEVRAVDDNNVPEPPPPHY